MQIKNRKNCLKPSEPHNLLPRFIAKRGFNLNRSNFWIAVVLFLLATSSLSLASFHLASAQSTGEEVASTVFLPFLSGGRAALDEQTLKEMSNTQAVAPSPSTTGATISTDLPDYPPGSIVTITGINWKAGEAIHIFVNDDTSNSWTHESGPDPVADADGNFTYQFQISYSFIANYSVIATGADGSGTATTYFTDANSSADLDQCANDPAPSPNTDGCNASASDWVNGNLGASKSSYLEGDSIPYRLKFDNLSLASHTVTIEWDTTKDGTHAIDYLTTFNRTVANANPCLGISGCSTFTTFAIPADPQVTGASVTPVAGNFTLYGGTISAVSAYSYSNGAGFAGNKSARITITFTPSQANPVLAWGGHIATRADWGLGNSAVTISGSPYHTSLINLDGSGGNQDRSLAAEAVIFPASLTIIKDATPNGPTSFGFTASPSPLTNFNLVDDGTSANTKVFGNIITFNNGGNFAATVNESSVPLGWGFDSVSCTVTSPNGGSYTTISTTVNVTLKEGENWTCTYLNSPRTGTLIVKKHVINDNGGNKTAGDFTLHVKAGNTDVSGSPAAGSESGTSYTLNAGTYVVSEETPPSGYTQTGFSGDCDSSGNVTVVVGQTKTCTITNDDIAPKLTLVKTVKNDNGGNKLVSDFPLFISGTPATSGIAYDQMANVLLTASETNQTGYAASTWGGDCAADGTITLLPGDNKTCTLTNDDQQAYVIVEKKVINDNGGSAQPDDFKLTLDGNPTTSGTKIAVNPGSYTAGETQLFGYTFTGFSGDCDNTGKVTVALGETKTCTLTNDDQQAYVIVEKKVINNNGGSAQPDDFKLTLDGNPTTSGTKIAVNPGSYTAGETQLSGYTFTGYSGDCDNTGKVTVALGETKTCTLTNDDQQAYVIVEKKVINDNGGSAQPDDFKLTLDGNPTTSGTKIAVNPGSYTAGETQLSGYTFTSFSGGCDNTGKVTVALGETKTCTLTNDDQQAYVIVEKKVINDNGGSAQPDDFKLTLDGNPTTSGTKIAVNPGSYTAGETQLSGYTFTSFSGDCDNTGKVTVALGETKTCTLTNDDQQAYVIVEKKVINDNGGSAQPDDFKLTLDGKATTSGTKVPVNPGNHTGGETQLSSYTFIGYSGDCDSTGKVTVALGETKTCTLTNDDQPGKIIIKKITKPLNTGSFSFTTTGDNGAGALPDYQPFVLAGGTQNEQTLDAGVYTVKEDTQLGWILTGIGGGDPIDLDNFKCTVTGTGGSIGIGTLSTQSAAITLKNGDTVTCVFENTGNGATRTQGFWATHPQLAEIAWFGGTKFGHTFPGVANTTGISNLTLCPSISGYNGTTVGKDINTLGKLMGGFWSEISKKSTGTKRTALDQARMQLLQQLLAAELNASAFGSVPSGGIGMFATWEAAYCGTNQTAIQQAMQGAASFNNSGDSATFTPGTSADSKNARAIANKLFWDILP